MRMYWGAWTFNLNGTYFCIWRKTPCHRGPNVGYLDFKKFRVKPNTITTITMMHCFFRHPVSVCESNYWIISGHFCRKILQKSQICTLRCCLRGGLGPTEVPPLPAAPPPPSSTKLRLLHTPHWHWPTFFYQHSAESLQGKTSCGSCKTAKLLLWTLLTSYKPWYKAQNTDTCCIVQIMVIMWCNRQHCADYDK